MDASIVVDLEWVDKHLRFDEWLKTSDGYTNSIRADRSQVWVPEVEVLNRVEDLSTKDEKNRQLKIESNGRVKYSRSYRIRSQLSLSLWDYPYDVQETFVLRLR